MAWQEDVLVHVRKTHFALVGLCLAMCIAVSLVPQRAAESAFQQAEAILQFVSTPLVEQVRASIPAYEMLISPTKFDILKNENKASGELATFQWVNKDTGISSSVGSHSWDTTININGALGRISAVGISTDLYGQPSLEQFFEIWNFLNTAKPARIFEANIGAAKWFRGGVELTSPPQINEGQQGVGPPTGSDLLNVTYGLYQEKDPTRRFAARQWFVIGKLNSPVNESHPGFDEVWIPVTLTFSEFNALVTLFADRLPANAPNVSAKQAFSDLANMAKGLESIRLDQLTNWVRTRRDSQSSQITAFGIDIPLSLVGRWGAILIIAAQLYFLLHHRHAVRRINERSYINNFSWIGTYPDKLSRLLLVLSGTILPIITCIYVAQPLALWKMFDLFEFGLVACLVLISAYIALNTLNSIRQLRKMPMV